MRCTHARLQASVQPRGRPPWRTAPRARRWPRIPPGRQGSSVRGPCHALAPRATDPTEGPCRVEAFGMGGAEIPGGAGGEKKPWRQAAGRQDAGGRPYLVDPLQKLPTSRSAPCTRGVLGRRALPQPKCGGPIEAAPSCGPLRCVWRGPDQGQRAKIGEKADGIDPGGGRHAGQHRRGCVGIPVIRRRPLQRRQDEVASTPPRARIETSVLWQRL